MYIAPKKDCLGRNNIHKLCYYYYVPILDCIALLIKSGYTMNQVLPQHEHSNKLFDFSSGKACKRNDFFKDNNNGIQIILFHNAFQLFNPLGSSKHKHKLVGVYMSLRNIPLNCRSKVFFSISIIIYRAEPEIFWLQKCFQSHFI